MYKDDEGLVMVEYQVDLHNIFQKWIDEETTYGGRLSVRIDMDIRPLIIFGYNECIFK